MSSTTIKQSHIEFIVHADPVPKGRPRVTKSGVAYTPPRTRAAEAVVADALRVAMAGRAPFVGPVGVDIRSIRARPKSKSRACDGPGLLWCPVRYDLDNAVKLVMDGCAGAWGDDSQVVRLTASKMYAEKDGKARTAVIIYALGSRGPL